MLTVALRVMGKEVSSKVDREVHEYGLVAGLKFVEGGVTLCDEAVAALELALDEVLQAKRMTEKSARRLAGIMQYSASAFEWSVGDQTWRSRHKSRFVMRTEEQFLSGLSKRRTAWLNLEAGSL